MKLSFSTLLILSLILSLSFVSVAEALLYDFENEAQVKDWTVVSGTWKFDKGAYVQEDINENPNGHGAQSFFGESDWSDYTIEVKGKVIERGGSGWLGIDFRYQDDSNHYLYLFRVSDDGQGGNTEVGKFVAGSFTKLSDFAPTAKHKLNEWYTLKVEASGSSIKCYIDDEIIFDIKDDTFKKGKIALATGLAHAAVDEVNVEGSGIPVTKTDIQPAGKIAEVWGKIKAIY